MVFWDSVKRIFVKLLFIEWSFLRCLFRAIFPAMYVRCWAWVELENPIASCWDWRFFVAENESNLHCIQIWLVCSPSHISASGLMLGWPKWTNDVSIYISISTKGYHQTTLYQKSIICQKKYRSKSGFLPKMLTSGFEFLPDYAHIGIWTHNCWVNPRSIILQDWKMTQLCLLCFPHEFMRGIEERKWVVRGILSKMQLSYISLSSWQSRKTRKHAYYVLEPSPQKHKQKV